MNGGRSRTFDGCARNSDGDQRKTITRREGRETRDAD
jgi:hypothetical protein